MTDTREDDNAPEWPDAEPCVSAKSMAAERSEVHRLREVVVAQ